MKCALHLAAGKVHRPVVTVVEGFAVCEPCRIHAMGEILRGQPRAQWIIDRIADLIRGVY